MRIGVAKNKKKIFLHAISKNTEIHPLWLRERITNSNYLDKNNGQRLYEPSEIKKNLKIKSALIKNKCLNVKFNDGVKTKFIIRDLIKEISTKNKIKDVVFWDSKLYKKPFFKFKNTLFNSKEGFRALKNFYKYGFMIIKSAPVKKNYLIKFANIIGILRKTNFGVIFNVKSVRRASDLAYTSCALSAHTDNPYRRPIPGIQLLHCLKNDSVGGFSTLTDGFSIANYMRKKYPKYFNLLSSIKIRFTYQDNKTILENWGETIELNTDKTIKRVRLSPRLDYVPVLQKDKLDKFYKARTLFIKLCNSKKFMIEFKLKPGDIMIMDNYRTLHGRTSYNMSVGERHLQGCYVDHDSVESNMKNLQRKFNL